MLSGWQTFAFFMVSFLASTIGAIAGIGGGVIIKPAMDAFHVLNVNTISFLSGLMVLSMSGYNVVRSLCSGGGQLRLATVLPLGIGASLGGVGGKRLFELLLDASSNADLVSAIQSGCLIAVTASALLYTWAGETVKTYRVRSKAAVVLIGTLLGVVSSFLGIGGGPVNLMVLSYFFSMGIKEAAQNSLMVIMLSQIASLFTTFLTDSVPAFSTPLLILLIIGGIGGGILGRIINRKLEARRVRSFYRLTVVAIILICAYNMVTYL